MLSTAINSVTAQRTTPALFSRNLVIKDPVGGVYKTPGEFKTLAEQKYDTHPEWTCFDQYKTPRSAISPGVLSSVMGEFPYVSNLELSRSLEFPYVSNLELSRLLKLNKIPPQATPKHLQLPYRSTSLNKQNLLEVCSKSQSSSTSSTIILTVLKLQKDGSYKLCSIERTVINGNIQGLTLKGSNVASDGEQDNTKKLNPGDLIVSAKINQQASLEATEKRGESPAPESVPSTPLESSIIQIAAPAPSNSGDGNQDKGQPQQKVSPARRSSLKKSDKSQDVSGNEFDIYDSVRSGASTPKIGF